MIILEDEIHTCIDHMLAPVESDLDDSSTPKQHNVGVFVCLLIFNLYKNLCLRKVCNKLKDIKKMTLSFKYPVSSKAD